MNIRQAAWELGLSRKTIWKMMQFSLPPGYKRKPPVQRPKLGPWLGVIDQILADDPSYPKKQRHTAKRIFDRLKAEHGFGGDDVVGTNGNDRSTVRAGPGEVAAVAAGSAGSP